MASQHPPYSHPPGPSSYYAHSPPPHHPYGFAPNPNAIPFYPYPPPMSGHSPLHQPASPRLNGSARGGYPSHRPGPSYQHYQHLPPQHFMPSQHITPSAVSPTAPYAHSQKYSPHGPQIPYSPSYPPQPNGYPPHPWHTQPLSPLPKQLSMLPPPQSHTQEPLAVPPFPVSHQLTQDRPPVLSPVSPRVDAQQLSQVRSPSPNVAFEQAQPPLPDGPSSPQQLPERSFTEQSAISEASSSPRPKAAEISISGWVIWSRKGKPSDAPGVIISPRANPPEHVLQKALHLPSPPASPKLKPKTVQRPALPQEQVKEAIKDESPESVPSSSVTETTPSSSTAPDTPVPGSPFSSTTSVSLAAGSPAVEKPVVPLVSLEKVEPAPEEVVSAAVPSLKEVSISENAQPPASASISQPIPSAPSPQPSAPSSAAVTPPTSRTPQNAPLKKSWASLLQPSDASSSKSGLPTSSVVGFSIPASTSGAPSPSGAPTQTNPELLQVLTSGPTGSMSPPKLRPRGIINTGNMCFANAVLQVLVYCPPFYRLFTELGKHITGPVVGPQKDGTKATPLVEAIIEFLKEFNPRSAEPNSKGKEREEDDFYDMESFIPNYVYDVMKEKKRFASMIGGYQEDAEEFLGFFLDTLEEELFALQSSLQPQTAKAAEQAEAADQVDEWLQVGRRNKTVITRTIKSMDSPITRIFGGKFRSTLRAPRQKDSATVEDWRALRLDISRDEVHTIKDALQLISHPQPVQISLPTQPGQEIEATQQALIESLPPILVLHMKRFMYDTKVGDVVKIGKQVAYGPELEITPDLLTPAQRRPHPVKYQLFGVLYHHGQSASGGHYTLDVLHPNRDMNDRPRPAWIRIDDELVSDIRADDVFGTQERDDRCAYLLFYRRINTTTAVSSGTRTRAPLAPAHNAR